MACLKTKVMSYCAKMYLTNMNYHQLLDYCEDNKVFFQKKGFFLNILEKKPLFLLLFFCKGVFKSRGAA